MPEMLQVTGALIGEGLGDSVALITDGRFLRRNPRVHGRPRRSRSLPRRADRRPRGGRYGRDRRRGGELRVELSDDEIAARLAGWSPPAPRYESGVLAKYAALVSTASEGAVTRP
jgi:dihydroxy-acid dehydratase